MSRIACRLSDSETTMHKREQAISPSISDFVRAMQISIDERYLEHIERKVKSGSYASPDAVIAKALALLDEHDESLADECDGVRARILEGAKALDDGDFSEYTDETLHELFDDVRRRGITQRGSHNA